MSDINNLRFQLGAEIEALVAEINELKKRLAELETKLSRMDLNRN